MSRIFSLGMRYVEILYRSFQEYNKYYMYMSIFHVRHPKVIFIQLPLHVHCSVFSVQSEAVSGVRSIQWRGLRDQLHHRSVRLLE